MTRRTRSLIVFLLWLSIVFLLTGCLGREKAPENPFFTEWKAKAETSLGHSPIAASPTVRYPNYPEDGIQEDAFIESRESKSAEDDALSTDPVSLEMQDVEVGVILRALARSVDQNVILNPGVTGTTSLNIRNAPWNEVFLSLLNAHELTYLWEGSILRILTKEERTRQLASERKIRVAEPLVTAVIHVDYADPDVLGENLKQFLSIQREADSNVAGALGGAGGDSQGGIEISEGAVLVDPNTHSLMIQATKSDIDRLLPLIKHLDRPTEQVLIEAHIVETNMETARELGVQWGGVYHGTANGSNHWVTSGSEAGKSWNIGDTAQVNPGSGNVVNFPANLTDDVGFSLGYIAEDIAGSILSVQLSALEKAGHLNILSRPSVTTLDNQMATIESGKEVPFQTVEDGEVKVEFKKASILLEVVPHVIDGKTLKLNIKTRKDELDWTNKVNGNPTIITKNAETRVVLFDGETTVIGGLNKEKDSDSKSGVPWLMDIPFIGNLFKGSSRQNEKEELLIFITPRILRSNAREGVTDQG